MRDLMVEAEMESAAKRQVPAGPTFEVEPFGMLVTAVHCRRHHRLDLSPFPSCTPAGLDARAAVLLEWGRIDRKIRPLGTVAMTDDVLQRLAALIGSRRYDSAAKSYTRELLDAGTERCARKLGEEAVETVIAAVGQDATALRREAADLVYHLLVLLESRQLPWSDVLGELDQRMGTSGLAEKAARKNASP